MTTTLGQMDRPTGGQLAGAAVLGIVFGALGAGFALALGLTLLVLGVLALWRVVTLLGYLVDGQRPVPAGAGRKGRRA